MAEAVVITTRVVEVVEVASSATTVVVSTDRGPQGATGAPGVNGPASFVHSQGVAASVWTVTHNLGWRPNATVLDSTNRTVEGDIVYTSANVLTLTFSSAFAGTAYLS